MSAPDQGPRTLADVLRDHRDRLLDLPGVTAVAEGQDDEGGFCIVVLVAPATPEARDALPVHIEGHSVVVREGGPFRAAPGG
jgi:hypothetical protein